MVLVLAGCLWLVQVLPAAAAPAWLAEAFGRHGEARQQPQAPTGRYGIDAGGGFVLDRSGAATLLKFDDSAEVWVLAVSRGPRGDEIFTDDLGQPLLRATRLGGVTVFTPAHPEGAAAALEGPTGPIRLSRVDPAQLYQRLVNDSARASRAAQHLIAFQALEVDPASSGLIADTAAVAGEAMSRLAEGPSGRRALARVGRIDFVRGRSAGVSFSGGVITLTIAPEAGLGGRPSSARILQVLGVSP